jgi:hypothetical protein
MADLPFDAWQVDGLPRWGVPDWQSEVGYPAPKGEARMRVWAWEFLRRNHDYRTFWHDNIRPLIGSESDYFESIFVEMADQFGLVGIPPSPMAQNGAFFAAANICRIQKFRSEDPTTVKLQESEVGYIFDMTLPLEDQFAAALKDANEFRRYRKQQGLLALKNARETSAKYVTYLRILDADDSNADDSKIGEILFPNRSNIFPESQRSKTLTNHRCAARRLRDSGYRRLAALGPK